MKREKMNRKIIKGLSIVVIAAVMCAVFILPADSPASANDADGTGSKGSKAFTVAIDAGHQAKADLRLERMDPDRAGRKYRVSGGASGAATHVPEYKLNLAVAKRLRKTLESRGYHVYMVRKKNNVRISCRQRALKANKSGADICIRLHADSADSSSVKGASALYKSRPNSYAKKSVNKKSRKLSRAVLKGMCSSTKARNRGLFKRNDLTGNNWSRIPVTLIEMGFMSSPSEDRKMQKAAYQKKIARGIADGIDSYFGK